MKYYKQWQNIFNINKPFKREKIFFSKEIVLGY